MRRLTPLVVAPLLLAATACSGASTPTSRAPNSSAASPSASSSPGTTLAWERTDLKPVTRPVAAAGRLLLYVQDGSHLSVVALDPATGKTVWTEQATDSGITGGVAFGLTVVKDRVVFLTPTGDGARALAAAADAATGKRLWTNDVPALYRDAPSECSDDKTQVCAIGSIKGRSGVLRLALDDGTLRLKPQSGPDLRAMGAELQDTGERKPDYIARVTPAGRQVWKRPLAQMFGADVSSDTGWNWDVIGGTIVGSMGLRRDASSDEYLLGAAVLVAIDKATGRTLWRVPQRELHCYGTMDEVLGTDDTLPFRCAYTGVIRLSAGRETKSSGATAVVEGFDPKTGRTTWRVDVGAAPALALDDPAPMGLGGSVVVVPRLEGPPLRIDLRTGAHADVVEPVDGWCAQQNPYSITASIHTGGRQGQTLLEPCRSDGRKVFAPEKVTDEFGTKAGGHLVWAARDGVHAVKA
ncbi:MAG: PQQ-binding-like beta-propeller repeat protein [Actinobacteria bacterium]|nr:PQQ-binding-like beta-propeller repeat protein [Actinomycetota bacterium]